MQIFIIINCKSLLNLYFKEMSTIECIGGKSGVILFDKRG